MKYENTGKFTEEQVKLAKKIAKDIRTLEKSGCTILAKCDTLCVYKDKDFAHKAPLDACECHILGVHVDREHPLPYINCGKISGSGADDEECFVEGYITD